MLFSNDKCQSVCQSNLELTADTRAWENMSLDSEKYFKTLGIHSHCSRLWYGVHSSSYKNRKRQWHHHLNGPLGNTYPVKIRSINAVLRSYDVILVGRHRNAGSHHETLVTRPHGSENEMKTCQLRAEHKRGKWHRVYSLFFALQSRINGLWRLSSLAICGTKDEVKNL